MLPRLYQKALQAHLSEAQYLTLMLLVMLIQSQRQIQLAHLASVFPQPIQYHSRIRNLQRFLILPQLSVRLLWFPILKYCLRQEVQARGLNRDQRRHLKKLKQSIRGALILALDRMQWKGRTLLMVTVIWGNHALPVYWELISNDGSSNFLTQVRLLKRAIQLFKPHSILVLGDCEFHSPKLAQVLSQLQVDFCLRQKKSLYLQVSDAPYEAIKQMGFGPRMEQFLVDIRVGKRDHIAPVISRFIGNVSIEAKVEKRLGIFSRVSTILIKRSKFIGLVGALNRCSKIERVGATTWNNLRGMPLVFLP